jgi:hypothetical protein
MTEPRREMDPCPYPIDAAATLAEMLRLRAWLNRLANCQAQSSAEEHYARRIRYMARRALQGDPA